MSEPDRDAAARQWLRGVTAAGFVPGLRSEARAALEKLLDRLVAVVVAEPFDPSAGQRVGADLVAMRMAAPDVLGATVRALGEWLPVLAGERAAGRISLLLEQVVNGFAAAMRDAAMSAGESLNRTERIVWRARQERLRGLRYAAELWSPVTHLPNRANLRTHLARLIGSASPGDRLGLCLLSVDGFAGLNDALGHARGDDLLAAVGRSLRRVEADVAEAQAGHNLDRGAADRCFLAHLGAEQFVLAVADTTGAEQMIKLADQAGRVLADARLLDIDGYGLRVTTTAGIAEGEATRADADGWLRDAHLALGWAQRDRRTPAVHDALRAGEEVNRHLLAAAMPTALDRGEFVPHFQPLYRLADRAVIGVEALARWRRPDGELLGPHPFITLAEQTGLIGPLGLAVLEKACRQGAAWRAHGHDLLISVNVSPHQLADAGLVAEVAEVLHRTELPPDRLQLEITESAAADGHAGTLRGLADLGVSLAVDDFGTGYSSLATLQHPPVTTVKLAAELIAAITDSATAVLRHTIALCHDLGITVTAEGIETETQEHVLRDLGCDTGQGFLFGRPAPAADLAALLVG